MRVWFMLAFLSFLNVPLLTTDSGMFACVVAWPVGEIVFVFLVVCVYVQVRVYEILMRHCVCLYT
jgi:hypothetical protein